MGELKERKVRDSGIEMLRILMMLQVVFLHVCRYGGFTEIATAHGGKLELFYWMIMMMCRCPIFVFIMIMGYFSVTSTISYSQPRTVGRKLWKTWAPMIFYSVALYLVSVPTGLVEADTMDTVAVFMPALAGTWYFMTCYLILILLMPFLNRMLAGLSKKDYLILLGIMFFILSVYQIIAKIPSLSGLIFIKQTVLTNGGKSMYDMIYMYVLGAYIRIYVKPRKKPNVMYLVAFLLLGVVNALLSFFLEDYVKLGVYNDNPFAVLQSVCIFLFFRDIKLKSPVINKISGYTLSVYLIHMDPFFKNVIWNRIFPFTQTKAFYSHYWFPFAILAICVAIFAGCCVIDEVRQMLFRGGERIVSSVKRRT